MFDFPIRPLRRGLGAAAVALTFTALALPAFAQQKTVRAMMHSPLRILDPILTPAHITREHGYMVYDTLVSMNAAGKPQPQMAEFTVSEDGKLYTFTLRDGLKFHDGAPVGAEDVVASLKRWSSKDTAAATLLKVTEAIASVDDKTITWTLSEPFPLLLDILAKPSSYPSFIMPARVAAAPNSEAITDYTGSGPFRMLVDEFQPGVKIAYEKFADYLPRSEPVDFLSGGKVVNVDRVEWIAMPDQQTAINALMTGEIDVIENTQVDLLPILQSSEDVVAEVRSPIGYNGILRMNFLHPPFDDVKIRRAAMTAISQQDIMGTMIGDPAYYTICGAIFGCGSPLGDETGAEILKAGGDTAKAAEMLKEAGYDGTPVVVLHPTDLGAMSSIPVVVADALRRAGFTVDLQSMDWQTLVTRRASQAAPKEGGWNLFSTFASVVESSNPLIHPIIPSTGKSGIFGWSDDPELEAMRAEFVKATSLEQQQEISQRIQARVLDQVIIVPFGSYAPVQARSKKLVNQVPTSLMLFWNLDLID